MTTHSHCPECEIHWQQSELTELPSPNQRTIALACPGCFLVLSHIEKPEIEYTKSIPLPTEQPIQQRFFMNQNWGGFGTGDELFKNNETLTDTQGKYVMNIGSAAFTRMVTIK